MRALVLAVLAGLAAALLSWTQPADPALSPPAGQGVLIHVLDNGFHTDIAVPRAVIEARGGPLGQAAAGLAPGDWVLIGWGDARFYVEQGPFHLRLPDGLRALFRPGNPSVVMLSPHRADPGARSHGRESLILSPQAARRLLDRVEASLTLRDGRAFPAARRPGDDALFLASDETFSVFHLCNHWSAEVLNAAGVPVRPVQAIRSAEVMGAVRRAGDSPMKADGSSLARTHG